MWKQSKKKGRIVTGDGQNAANAEAFGQKGNNVQCNKDSFLFSLDYGNRLCFNNLPNHIMETGKV